MISLNPVQMQQKYYSLQKERLGKRKGTSTLTFITKSGPIYSRCFFRNPIQVSIHQGIPIRQVFQSKSWKLRQSDPLCWLI
jgi:hypothetical protein